MKPKQGHPPKPKPARIDHLFHDQHAAGLPFYLHHGDMTDSSSLTRIIQQVQPDEIYNLAAQSHVAVSFEEPEYTANSDAFARCRADSIDYALTEKISDGVVIPLAAGWNDIGAWDALCRSASADFSDNTRSGDPIALKTPARSTSNSSKSSPAPISAKMISSASKTPMEDKYGR